MQEMIDRKKNNSADLSNGTAYTIVDLYPNWMVTEFDLKKIARETGLEEILSLTIDYYETKNYIFVHGWIPTYDGVYLYNPDWRDAPKELWEKSRWQNPVLMYRYKIFEPNKTIVCGHWHCSALWHEANPREYDEFGENENFEPFITKDMIALDTCTHYTRKVNVVVLED